MKKLFCLGLGLILISCSSVYYFNNGKDVHTGIMIRNEEIIVMDRNVGAKSFGDDGTYLTWRQAIDACPKGYHLMTMAEAVSLSDSEKYDSFDKLVNGDLGLPLAGFIPFYGGKSKLEKHSILGYYHLADIYEKNQSMAMQLNPAIDSASAAFLLNSRRKHKDKMSVRCVKDYRWSD